MPVVTPARQKADRFHDAAKSGNEKLVKQLLAETPTLISTFTRDGWSALDFAADEGHDKIVTLLIAAASSDLLNSTNHDGNTALHLAANAGHTKAVSILLEKCPKMLNSVERWGNTALHLAAIEGHDQVVQQLLAVATSSIIRVMDVDGLTALHCAASRGYATIVTQLVAACPGLTEVIDENGWTALFWAINDNHEAIADQLLDADPELDIALSGDTPLHLSMERPQLLSLTTRLWQLHPETLQMRNENGCTPFFLAVLADNEPAIQLVQGTLSIDEIVEAFASCNKSYERFRPLLSEQCESLAMALNQDVLGTVYEYLGFDFVRQPQRKKHKGCPP